MSLVTAANPFLIHPHSFTRSRGIESSEVHQVHYLLCNEGPNTVTGVAISPCEPIDIDGFSSCIFRRGTRIRVQATVFAPFSSSSLVTEAVTHAGREEFPLPVSGSNPCVENMMPACPMKAGLYYIFTYYIDVPRFYPSGRTTITFIVRDTRDEEKIVGCVKLHVLILAEKSKGCSNAKFIMHLNSILNRFSWELLVITR
ncbi:ML domain-containing protein [Trichonephila inaurata madagascariensis]|uniref:ML domain-containing protein n=1 Tax=Trichonephila inaurata madagascariensis TaxID=2747483 RepID=A0A8X7CS87_9ARAC|nr:ML domain-containing protein [Trichonephila inaurata madagascariensis]